MINVVTAGAEDYCRAIVAGYSDVAPGAVCRLLFVPREPIVENQARNVTTKSLSKIERHKRT